MLLLSTSLLMIFLMIVLLLMAMAMAQWTHGDKILTFVFSSPEMIQVMQSQFCCEVLAPQPNHATPSLSSESEVESEVISPPSLTISAMPLMVLLLHLQIS
jgi:hypothetical protein